MNSAECGSPSSAVDGEQEARHVQHIELADTRDRIGHVPAIARRIADLGLHGAPVCTTLVHRTGRRPPGRARPSTNSTPTSPAGGTGFRGRWTGVQSLPSVGARLVWFSVARRVVVALAVVRSRCRRLMVSLSSAEQKRKWDAAGWCVIEDVNRARCRGSGTASAAGRVPYRRRIRQRCRPGAQRALSHRARCAPTTVSVRASHVESVALHDRIIDLAERLLTIDDIRLYQAAVVAEYADAAPDYEQLLARRLCESTRSSFRELTWAISTSRCSYISTT